MYTNNYHALANLILALIPASGTYISWQELVDAIKKKDSSVKDWELVRKILGYYQVTGAIWKVGVFDEKYTKKA